VKPGPEVLHHQLLITGDELRGLHRNSWSMAGRREIEGIYLASPVQVYLDFLSFRGRGERRRSGPGRA
jgi:hypothetical protein